MLYTNHTMRQVFNMYGKGLNDNNNDTEENIVTITFPKTTPRSISKLKESTGRLMCLLDEIEAKTRTKGFEEEFQDNSLAVRLNFQDQYDDCSVYNKLTRICQCLNRKEYNDFTIEFNIDTRYHTSHFGEILKNIRSIKKFLYIGNDYSRNALKFLIEGLTTSTLAQKEEITKACAYADICNIYDDNSLVTKCICFKYENIREPTNSILAAQFLDKLTTTEEGIKYLTLTSKLTVELIELFKSEGNNLDPTLRDIIYDVLDTLKLGSQIKNYYFKSSDTCDCSRTVNILIQYHEYMSLEEASNYLNTLKTLSESLQTKIELVKRGPLLISIFKSLIIRFDNSELNIIVTNILNNIVTRTMVVNELENNMKNTLIMEVKRKETRSTSPIPVKHTKSCKVDFEINKKNTPMYKQKNNAIDYFSERREKKSK